jgi:acyl-coenzyme A thioesterase PaaI-like protein
VIDLPPYASLLRLSVEEGEEPLFRMPFHDDVVGRPGFLHGGAIAGLLEFAAFGGLSRAIGDPSVVMKPIAVTVDYMRGGVERDTFAAAVIQRLGTRVANVEAIAWQSERSTPIATARINFLLERP